MSRAIRYGMLLAALATAAPLVHAADVQLKIQPGSKLGLSGNSTVHAYHATANRIDARMPHQAAAWNGALPRGEAIEALIRAHGVEGWDVTIAVTGLKSGKDGLDKNMYKALLAPKHPDIRYTMTSYEVGAGEKSGEMAIDTKGKITVAGVQRDLAMVVTAVREGDVVRLKGSAPLLMTQFGIKPPTMMMGTLRTADQVVVHFDLIVGAVDATPMASSDGAAR